ncbi:MAG: response regulator transcription factor, partial [Pseudomonadota bacterium]
MSSAVIRLALADDQALIREGLKAILQSIDGLEVVIEADSGQRLIERLGEGEVDVIISDIRMPGLDGIEMTQRLRDDGSAIPVLLLTTFDDDELLPRATDAGAQGFLLKDVEPDDLAAAIREVAAGGSLLQPVTTEAVRNRYHYSDD